MNDMSLYSGIFDILGTIAFAVSGAITAVKNVWIYSELLCLP